jgi:hypothetical protein
MKNIIKPETEFTKILYHTKEKYINKGLYIKKKRWIYDNDKQNIIKEKKLLILNKNNNIIVNNLTFTVTTCKRFDYFRTMMDNFLYRCRDIDIVDRWICVDDCSSDNDRAKMMDAYPFFNFILKDESIKGHAQSMNILWNKIETEYVLHFEDDWIVNKDFSITSILNHIKDTKNSVDQIVFIKQINAKYPYIETLDNCMLYEQIYNHNSSIKPLKHREYDKIVDFDPQHAYSKDAYWWWPGFTLNPSIFNFTKIKEVGEFCVEEDELFEYDFSVRCYKKNIQIQILDLPIYHTGIISSYVINDKKRSHDV